VCILTTGQSYLGYRLSPLVTAKFLIVVQCQLRLYG